MYPLVLGRGVDVGQQPIDRSEFGERRGVHRRHPQHAVERRQLEAAGEDFAAHHNAGGATIAGQERLDTTRRSHPGAIPVVGRVGQSLENAAVQKWEIAGDDEHSGRMGAFERRQQPAHRSRRRHDVGVDRHTDIFVTAGVGSDDKDLVADPLQNVQLTEDDGAAVNEQPALVPPTESLRLAARQNRGGDVRVVHDRIMTDGRVGRLLAACLHQAIGEVLPQRLDFYEEWLDPDGLRDGNIGLAAVSAVLSFLRAEHDAYGRVVERAGTLAAEWTLASLPAWRRNLIARLPQAFRTRSALRVAAGVARSVLSTTRAKPQVRRGRAWLHVKSSLFCTVRDPQPLPLCGFYAAVAVEVLRRFGVTATARVDQCHAMRSPSCRVALELSSVDVAPDPAIAA